MTDTTSGLAKLREPFPANQISLLPHPTKNKDAMAQIPKGRCDVCGGWHAVRHIVHLSYVGHAALTDRLLDADPQWSWEPLAISPEGLPVLDPFGGMWIRLTVCGVTRLGYGHAGDKTGGDAIKEVIGDALRNAAMRFGAALDLWHKGQLHAEDDEPAPAAKMAPDKIRDWCQAIETAAADELDSVKREALAAATELKDEDAFRAFSSAAGKRRKELAKVAA